MPISEATWPTTIRKPQIAGASMQTFDTHNLYETIDGANIRVTAWRLPPSRYSCELLCYNSGELLNFEDFFITTLRAGNAWFTMPLAIGGGVRNCLCAFDGTYTTSQFGAPYNMATAGVPYRVNFDLLIYQPEMDKVPWL